MPVGATASFTQARSEPAARGFSSTAPEPSSVIS